jgi:hypothetical protein
MSSVNKQPVRVPLVDPNTGVITREWYRFFEQLFVRVGGEVGPTNNELDNGLQFDVRESEAAEITKRLNDLERLFHVSDTSAAVAQLSAFVSEAGIPTFMQQTEPTVAPSIWFKTDGTGRVIDIMQVTP